MFTEIGSVLILDGVDKVCSDMLTSSGIRVKTGGKLTKEELVKELENHDALIVRSATKVTADVLASCTRLKVIGRAGTGVDNIDLEAATRKGILVMNTPGGNTLSAAEHTCALISALSRSIPQACASLKAGAWDRKLFMGNELNGKTLAILGLGRIGREVAQRMQSFQMKTIGFDPMVSKESAASSGIELLELEEIWPLADYITVHTPLIKQTKHLVNEAALKKCKPSVKIVNVARGGIVDEQALFKALESGYCGGAALDVFESEPPTDFTLIKHPKVIATPHLGANTYEAQTRVAEEIAEQFIDMSEGRPLRGVVNAPALTLVGCEKAMAWIDLASSLASLASQICLVKTGPVDVKLELLGEEACKWHSVIEPAVQRGFVINTKKEVNLVSAKVFAQDFGLTVKSFMHQDMSSKQGPCMQITVIIKGNIETKLLGCVSNNRPTLFSWDANSWDAGVSLIGNLIFLKSSSKEKSFDTILKGKESNQMLSLLLSSGVLSVARVPEGVTWQSEDVYAQLNHVF